MLMERFPTHYQDGGAPQRSDVASKTCNPDLYPDLPGIVSDLSEIDRVIAVADIHGDLALAIKYLEIPKLIQRVYVETNLTVSMWYKDEPIKRFYEWIGVRTIVVQVGDQVDRCRPYRKSCRNPDATIDDEASDLTIMFFYHDLHIAALKADCALYSLLGNHEILNVVGKMDYVSHQGLVEFHDKNKKVSDDNITKDRIAAFKRDSTEQLYKKKSTLVEFLGCARLTSIIVGGYLFMHAGILPQLINLVHKRNGADPSNPTDDDKAKIIPTINTAVQQWLLTSYNKEDKEFVDTIIEGREQSPFWPRLFGNIKRNLDIETTECKKLVSPILAALNVKGVVVGHTPQYKININSTCSSKIWRVDIASSQAFDEVMFDGVTKSSTRQKIQAGRKPQVLEIIFSKGAGIEDQFNVLS
jgi:hypothetical protein